MIKINKNISANFPKFFSNGLALVRLDDKLLYIDYDGNEIISFDIPEDMR